MITQEEEHFPPVALKAELLALKKRLKKNVLFGTDGNYFLLIGGKHDEIEFTGYLTEAQMYKTLHTINKLLEYETTGEG